VDDSHDPVPALARLLRAALADNDLAALGALLAPNVTWGDPHDPRGCRTRDDVMRNFARLADQGVRAELLEVIEGTQGALAVMDVHWPVEHPHAARVVVHQLYVARDGQVVEIRGFDDRAAALEALDQPV